MPTTAHHVPVVITGLGPVTAVGVGARDCGQAIAQGTTAVRRRTLIVDLGKEVELPIADLSQSPPPGMDKALSFLTEQQCPDARDLAYAIMAAELATRDAQLDWDRRDNRIGMVQVFEAPGVESAVRKLFSLFAGPLPTDGPPPVYDLLADRFYNMQAFVYVHLLAKALGLHGFCTSVHNACSSGAFAIELAAEHIRSGQAEVMIVVGGEAFDTAVRLEWFRRLDLYSCGEVMRPFAASPTGFFVGEGAAALVLESADHAERRGAKPYATYLGGAFAHQGWKQTLPDVAAGRLTGVLQSALAVAGLNWNDIDLVIPHGAGTVLSDRYEAECLEKALAAPDMASANSSSLHAAAFKPAFGHLLAASGLIETTAGLLCLNSGFVPPAIGGAASSRRFPARFAEVKESKKIRHMLKMSTGFTGHDAAALFQAV